MSKNIDDRKELELLACMQMNEIDLKAYREYMIEKCMQSKEVKVIYAPTSFSKSYLPELVRAAIKRGSKAQPK